jgi:hypothetical protein
VLQAGERDLVFLVREVEPGAAGDEQRAADEREDEEEIAAEEPAALDPRDFAVLLPDSLDWLQAPSSSPRATLSRQRGKE